RFIPCLRCGALQIPSIMGEHDGLVERDEYDRQRLREDEGVSRCYEPSGLTPSDTTSPIYGSRASPGHRSQLFQGRRRLDARTPGPVRPTEDVRRNLLANHQTGGWAGSKVLRITNRRKLRCSISSTSRITRTP